ncbi:2-amino-4-hydroxy-6-hydroxymethyldihydropteridine pyrophosphokinase [Legionella oakridgensis ATCC 33761 = DSM 21215]|uniref:2-amino-4-hydroxy-6-hydroxymethyldihydropteridine pyrophosphokinase n=1 Tax=Legionella oakridgensis ATCC 33761 = DSM 21215 TaxID=1268635 RepID=W0BEW1_9GAMM|nr:2-amino-4-hydroxy-6-hydroxymethyldihydropteridine pyrophosphokinase [Legionella oakridgensis ATCC 33761 = DSM 21215]
MTRCYLGLGSNLNQPQRQLKQAIAKLQTLPRTEVTKLSSLYFSRPMGSRFQPRYCNMVLAINTTLSPRRLLQWCQFIEKNIKGYARKNGEHGRLTLMYCCMVK